MWTLGFKGSFLLSNVILWKSLIPHIPAFPCNVSVHYCLTSCISRKFYCSTNQAPTELSSWHCDIFSGMSLLSSQIDLSYQKSASLEAKGPANPPTQTGREQTTYLIQMDGGIISIRLAFHTARMCLKRTRVCLRFLDGKYAWTVGVWK